MLDKEAVFAVEFHSCLFNGFPTQSKSLRNSHEYSEVKIALKTQQWENLLSLLICYTLNCPEHNSQSQGPWAVRSGSSCSV